MKKLLKFIVYVLFLPFSVLISILKSKKMKGIAKLICSLLWIGLWVGFFAYCIAIAPSYTEEERAATKTAAVLLTPTKTDTPAPTDTLVPTDTQEPTETAIPSDTPVPTDTKEPTPTAFTISIQAGVPNQYSEELSLNIGTEFEQHFLGYFVPAGDYSAKNLDSVHPSQISIMSRSTHKTEEGWEESADGTGVFFKEGETKQITVPDGGYYIKVVEPASFILTAVEP